MADELAVDIRRRFAGGPEISAVLQLPLGAPKVLVLFGPSGAGKTTVLRCIAGLERPDAGTIQCGGQIWFDAARRTCLEPQKRRAGFLAQDYALFPHLTVQANVGYGARDMSREWLERFDLASLASRYPPQLSGGQLQRVALARAMAARPRVLLLDEPLSALDAPTRVRLRSDLRHMLLNAQVPVIVVTHDRTEALTLGDSIAIMIGGQLRQAGAPDCVFEQPADVEVAEAVGVETIHPGRVLSTGSGLITVEVGRAQLTAVEAGDPQAAVYACIRAESVTIERNPSGNPTSARNHLPAEITGLDTEGPLARVVLDCGFRLTALVTRQSVEDLRLRVGERVTAVVKATSIRLVPRG